MMPVTPHRKRGNYDLFSTYSWYVPGVGGMFVMLAMVLVGTVIGVPVMMLCNTYLGEEYAILITYPLMFIPAMMYAKAASQHNSAFDPGYKLNSGNFKPVGGLACAALVSLAVLAFNVIMEPVNQSLPEMPDSLKNALESMTEGTLWMNILSVSIMAPLFEEWLCRGMVLRGLLNHKNGNGNTMNPYWAIATSALFFALIHMNLWQGLNAFAVGFLLGYVYYKTGSLSLTMLMHCVNNSMALLLAHVIPEDMADMALWDVVGTIPFLALFAVSAAFMYFFVKKFQTISLQSPQGNCDMIQE